MKLSEFVLTDVKSPSNVLNLEYFADVTVSTGCLWFKKIERKKICRKYAGYWFFVDNGESTPGLQAKQLEKAYKAQESLRELHAS